jgi:hypothetical protein
MVTATERLVIEGPVEARNERGIRLEGDWYNVSKFRPLDLPPQGSVVRASVDSKGFLSAIELLDQADAMTAGLSACNSRLAVLQAAAAFGASRPDLKSSDVLRIAESWLAWVDHDQAASPSSREAC